MLLNTEVSQLVISDLSVVISVISEDVLDHVVQFVLILFQKTNHSCTYFSFIELTILVGIIGL